jgi:hypothetical protein
MMARMAPRVIREPPDLRARKAPEAHKAHRVFADKTGQTGHRG